MTYASLQVYHPDGIKVSRCAGKDGISIVVSGNDTTAHLTTGLVRDLGMQRICEAMIFAANNPDKVLALAELAAITCEDCGCGHVEMGGTRPEDGQ